MLQQGGQEAGLLQGKREEQGMGEQVAAQAAHEGALTLLAGAIREIRSLTRDLSPLMLPEAGIVPALQDAADDVRERFGLDCEFRCVGELPRIDSDRATFLRSFLTPPTVVRRGRGTMSGPWPPSTVPATPVSIDPGATMVYGELGESERTGVDVSVPVFKISNDVSRIP